MQVRLFAKTWTAPLEQIAGRPTASYGYFEAVATIPDDLREAMWVLQRAARTPGGSDGTMMFFGPAEGPTSGMDPQSTLAKVVLFNLYTPTSL